MIPSDAPMSYPPAPIHVSTPAGGYVEPEKASSEKQRRVGVTLVRSARPHSSASIRRVTRSQSGMCSARTLAAKNPFSPATNISADVTDSAPPQHQKKKHLAAPRRRVLNKSHGPNPSLSPPMDHSGNATASPAKGTWAAAAARQPNAPTLTPTLHKTG